MKNLHNVKRITFLASALGALFLAGCASQSQAPIEGIGPTSSTGAEGVKTSGLGQSSALDSQSLSELQSQIYNSDSYTAEQRQQMMQALSQMNCKVVHFGFDSTVIDADTKTCLNNVANYLVKYKQPIRLAGHTDPRGSEKYNLNLGQRRADSVSQYLMQQGVPQSQICTVSYGKSQPAANLAEMTSQMCSHSNDQSCLANVKSKAYYLDRRVEIGFGQKCG
ncbi:OmpA family protein [Fangia hongkongensis]|uniref:OmpA family protein n=1 Tax=Fangia hongkongensis TaxID=270495 RepID=UPI0003735F7B|nr:OmpA family protein [Fangia hongkongensis]MBK2125162.1 OmpA family protein [Fangia hongkongensis]